MQNILQTQFKTGNLLKYNIPIRDNCISQVDYAFTGKFNLSLMEIKEGREVKIFKICFEFNNFIV